MYVELSKRIDPAGVAEACLEEVRLNRWSGESFG